MSRQVAYRDLAAFHRVSVSHLKIHWSITVAPAVRHLFSGIGVESMVFGTKYLERDAYFLQGKDSTDLISERLFQQAVRLKLVRNKPVPGKACAIDSKNFC